MTTGTLIYLITMGFTLCIFGGITYLFNKKKDFSLLNGFLSRSEEEKQYLLDNGYLNAMGKVVNISFWLFLLTFIVGLLPIPFAFEIGITVFIVYLMVGLVWVQRYEVPHKRKKMLWTMGSLTVGTFLFLIIIAVVGYIDNEVIVTEDHVEITGMYGDEWQKSDVEEISLVEELPDVIVKTNGFATSGILKGQFNLEQPYGASLLFIKSEAGPFIYIQTNDLPIFLNRKDACKTEEIYEELLR